MWLVSWCHTTRAGALEVKVNPDEIIQCAMTTQEESFWPVVQSAAAWQTSRLYFVMVLLHRKGAAFHNMADFILSSASWMPGS